jgi:acyl-CoA-binding protein
MHTATDLQEQFNLASEDVKQLPDKPSNESLLLLYSFYKQATEGDVNVDEPTNPFDFVSRAKYEAWSSLKGKSKEWAMQEYVDLVHKLRS